MTSTSGCPRLVGALALPYVRGLKNYWLSLSGLPPASVEAVPLRAGVRNV